MKETHPFNPRRTLSTFARLLTPMLMLALAASACATRSWSIPLEQDISAINRGFVDSRVSFVAPTTHHVYVLGYDGTNWVQDARLEFPAVQGGLVWVEDTDTGVSTTTNGAAFFRLVRSAGNLTWLAQGAATVSGGSNRFAVLAASLDSVVLRKESDSTCWFAGLGKPSIQLDAIPITATVLGVSNGFLAAWIDWSDGTSLQSRLYSAANGSLLASNELTVSANDLEFVKPWGLCIWRSESRTLEEYDPGTLSRARTLPLQGCYGVADVARSGADLLILAYKQDLSAYLSTALLRITPSGGLVYDTPTMLDGLDLATADGTLVLDKCWIGSNKASARLCRLSDARVLTYDLFSDGGPASGQQVASAGGMQFAAKACFWWDGVEIAEISPVSGPWQAPSDPQTLNPSFLSPPALVFPPTEPGNVSRVSVSLTNASDLEVIGRLILLATDGEPGVFHIDNAAPFVPAKGALEVVLTYAPTRPGPSYASLQLFKDGRFTAITLAGRSPASPPLPPQLRANLERYATSQAGYLTNAKTMNLSCGWPESWHSDTHATEGYVVMHEVGLCCLCTAISGLRGWLPKDRCWQLIRTSLQTIELIQSKPAEFPDGSFYRYYWIRHPDGRDRLPSEVIHDPGAGNQPSSDDNGLLVHSLLLIRSLAFEQQQTDVSGQVDRILRRINLRRFITTDGTSIAMWRSAAGEFSPPPHWNTLGAEGPVIAAAFLAMNQLTVAEFTNVVGRMSGALGSYRQNLIPFGDYHAALFVRGVRSMSGLGVCPDDAQGAIYWMSCHPLVAAHLDWADGAGFDTLLSHVMSQTMGGVSQTGICPGNTSGGDPSGQVRSAPHAWFIPFARPQWLTTNHISRLLRMMQSYESLYFSAELGWQAAVPFTSAPPYQGTDAGRAFELLNAAYILSAIFDATAIADNERTLASRHPMTSAMAAAMRFADSGGALGLPLVRVASLSRSGATSTLGFESVGLTNHTLLGSPIVAGTYSSVPGATITNRCGGLFEATVTHSNSHYYFKVSGH